MTIHLFNTDNKNFTTSLKKVFDGSSGKRHISKSYTKGAMALCLSGKTEVGIDLEEMKPRTAETIEHFVNKFTTFEIKGIPIEINEHRFYMAWTAMESYFKLTGFGFPAPKDFIIDLEKQIIWYSKERAALAWFEYFYVDNYIICLSAGAPFSKDETKLICHGMEDYQ